MTGVAMVLRARFRQYWRSWLALSLLVAAAGGFVLTTASAGHRTANAFPEFRARHGYDVIAYSGQPLPRLSTLPHVSAATAVPVTVSDTVGCASCRKPIDTENFLVNEVPPGQLVRAAGARGADLAGFDSRFRSPDVYGTYDVDKAADAVEASIRPQVIGWYVLTGLAALVALAVIGQAMARQTAAERADHYALSTLGVRPREFVLLALLRTLLTGAAGAAGAVLIAVLASPLTPVGEARLAVPAAGRLSLDLAVVLPGALAVLAAATALSVWPALRHARLLRSRPQWQPASVTVAAGRAAAQARLPAPALIGIRHAFERGRDGQPVGTALLGTVMAVASRAVRGRAVGVRRRHAAAPAAGQRGPQARRGRAAQGARVRPPPGRGGRLLASGRGGAGRYRRRSAWPASRRAGCCGGCSPRTSASCRSPWSSRC